MDWKRVLRVVVCLVLVCTLVIGVSPIKAEAVLTEAVLASFTDDVILGIVGLVTLMASGFIVQPPDSQMLEDAGDALRKHVYEDMVFSDSFPGDPDDSDDEKRTKTWEELEKTAVKIKDQLTNAKWDGTDKFIAGLGLLGTYGSSEFIEYCIQQGFFEREVETPITTGHWSYNGLLFGPLADYDPSSYWYMILESTADTYYLVRCNLSSQSFYTYAADSTLRCNGGQFGYVKARLNYTSSLSVAGTKSSMAFISVIWSSHDLYDSSGSLVCAGSEPSTTTSTAENVEPIATVGPIVEGIIAGGLTAADVPIPEVVDLSSIFEGVETGGIDAALGNMQSAAAGLASGSIALDDFRQSITYVVDPGDDPTDPTEDPGPTEGVDDPDDPGGDSETVPADSTFADFPVLNFFAKLGELLQNISDGNLLGIKNLLDPWFQDIRGDLFGVRDDLSGIDFSIQDGFQDVIDANEQHNQLNQEIQQEQNNIISQGFAAVSSAVTGAIASAFVPSEGFIEGKINDLTDKYGLAESIANTGKDLKIFMTNLGSQPPVIYIDLGATRGSYNIGGRIAFIDLTWYSEYKPTMDLIISAFLWLWFSWRMLISLPGIIQGTSGFWSPPDNMIGFGSWRDSFYSSPDLLPPGESAPLGLDGTFANDVSTRRRRASTGRGIHEKDGRKNKIYRGTK